MKPRSTMLALLCMPTMLLASDGWRARYTHEDYSQPLSVEDHGISYGPISMEEMRYIARFSNLKHLQLAWAPEGGEMSREALQLVGQFSKLEWLSFCKEELRDPDLAFLPKLQNLIVLTIEGSDMIDPYKAHGLTDGAAQFLTALPRLESLIIRGKGPYSDTFVRDILRLPQLRKLELHSDALTDETLLAISKRAFTELELSSAKFSNRGFAKLLGMRSLTSIDLTLRSECSLRWREIDTYLNVGNPWEPKPNATIERRARRNTVDEIEVIVTEPMFTAGEIRKLSQNPKVTALILGDSNREPKLVKLDSAALQALTEFSQLKELAIHGESAATDSFVGTLIDKLPKLERLRLTSRALTDATLGHLARHPALEKIGVSSPSFTKEGLKPLPTSKSLRWIEVNAPRVTPAPNQSETR